MVVLDGSKSIGIIALGSGTVPGTTAAKGKSLMIMLRAGSLVLTTVLVACPTFAQVADRPADYGKRWVRSHPFTIMGLTQRPGAVQDDRYAQAGLNTMLAWKRWEKLAVAALRMGIPYHTHLSKGLLGGELMRDRRHEYETMTADEKASAMEASRPDPLGDELRSLMVQLYHNFPGCDAFVVWDEPKRPSMWTAAKVVTWLKQTFPDTLVYSNAYPYGSANGKYFGGKWLASDTYQEPSIPYDYAQYLRDLVQIIGSDLVMVDIYPFRLPPEGDETEFIHRRYFACLVEARRVGLELNVPYWIFVQTFGKDGYTRTPSESDLRMQVFASLAFGFTGITYFTYDHVYDGALLQGEDEHQSTPLYYDAGRVSVEIANLGQTLRFLTSTEVRLILGRHEAAGRTVPNVPPLGVTVYERDKPIGPILNLSLSEDGPRRNALIGLFEDDEGGTYFMVTNLHRGEGIAAGDARQTGTITVDPAVKRLTRLSRETGAVEELHLQNHRLTVTLPAGTGDLYGINDAAFPGS